MVSLSSLVWCVPDKIPQVQTSRDRQRVVFSGSIAAKHLFLSSHSWPLLSRFYTPNCMWSIHRLFLRSCSVNCLLRSSYRTDLCLQVGKISLVYRARYRKMLKSELQTPSAAQMMIAERWREKSFLMTFPLSVNKRTKNFPLCQTNDAGCYSPASDQSLQQ